MELFISKKNNLNGFQHKESILHTHSLPQKLMFEMWIMLAYPKCLASYLPFHHSSKDDVYSTVKERTVSELVFKPTFLPEQIYRSY